jgi:hypothetical protein
MKKLIFAAALAVATPAWGQNIPRVAALIELATGHTRDVETVVRCGLRDRGWAQQVRNAARSALHVALADMRGPDQLTVPEVRLLVDVAIAMQEIAVPSDIREPQERRCASAQARLPMIEEVFAAQRQ